METIDVQKDIGAILRRVLESTNGDQLSVVASVHSAFYGGHPHDISYRNPSSVPKMVAMGIVTVVERGTENKVDGLNIYKFDYYTLKFDLNKVKAFLSGELKTQSSLQRSTHDEVFVVGKLKINITQGTIQYAETSPVEVNLENKQYSLLVYLCRNRRVVPYKELSKALGYTYEGEYDKTVNRSISQVKRDLQDLLIQEFGVSKEEATSLIVTKRMRGYKLIQDHNRT